MKEFTFTVSQKHEGKRLDTLAAELMPAFSRSRWQKAGVFLRNGEKASYKAKAISGDTWNISCEPACGLPPQLEAWDFPLKILAESKSWIVIEKPIDVSIHPSASDPDQHTIINAIVHQFPAWEKAFPDEPLRPGIVHRLDKPTSGVLLIARTDAALRYFQNHWKETEKWYRAVVHGKPPQSGRIEAAIARDFKNRTKMAVSAGESAKDAESYFERDAVSPYGRGSLLRVRIPTGRTHQIRVHLSAIGFPILGDLKYGGEKEERLLLHAESLTFPDPDNNGEMRTVKCPVPEIFFKQFPEFIQEK
jgi:23S rRNA pseudouridine1911/1915/1917 synthase